MEPTREQKIRESVRAIVDDIRATNSEMFTEDGIGLHPFEMLGDDTLIVTNQKDDDGNLITYKHRKSSGRLILYALPVRAYDALLKCGSEKAFWCKRNEQRIMNVVCATNQCTPEELCDGTCKHALPAPEKVKSASKKASKKVGKADIPPEYRTQKDYKGNPEQVDVTVYSTPVVCACGEYRWIKPQDAFQVKTCKPCATIARKERTKAWRRNRQSK